MCTSVVRQRLGRAVAWWLALVCVWAAGGASALAQAPDDTEELFELSIEELLEVEVTSATKSAQSIRQAPATITVITARQIRERGYQNVGEALESLPGLDLPHDHYQYNLGVRGISPGARAWSRSIKLMIDGQPVSFRPSQETWLDESLIPIEAIERIEVIKGPASALYGANAYLGVVNIITRSGESAQVGRLTARYGYGSRLNAPGASMIAGAAANGWDGLVSMGGVSTALEGYGVLSLPGRTHREADQRSQAGHPITASGFAKLQYADETLGRFTLDASYQQLERDTELMDWGAMAHDNRQSLANHYLRLRYSRTLGDAWDVNVGIATAGGSPTERDRLNIGSNLDTHVERQVGYRGYDLYANVSSLIGPYARVSLGADYTLEDQELLAYTTINEAGLRVLNPPSTTRTGDKLFSNAGAYLHAMWNPLADEASDAPGPLGIVAGVRVDQQNIYGTNVNYSAGVVYQLTDALYAKALFGTSFRAPSSNQLYSNYLETGGVIGNAALAPERAHTAELTMGGTPLPWLSFEVTGFYTHITGKVETRPNSGAGADNPLAQNISAIDSVGAEASASVSHGPLNGYLNYSLQHSLATEPNPLAADPGAEVSYPTLSYPKHMLKLGLGGKWEQAYVQAYLEGRYIGPRLGSQANNEALYGVRGTSSDRYQLDPYVLLDLHISSADLEAWEGRETRIGLKVSNLLDAQYAMPGYGGFDVPGFRRSVMFTVSQAF